jgi:hypothetical protein
MTVDEHGSINTGKITLWGVMTPGGPSRTVKPHQPQTARGEPVRPQLRRHKRRRKHGR